MKDRLFENRSGGLWRDTLWQKGREAIIKAGRNPDAAMAGKLGEVLKSMGQSLEKDERMRRAINQFARRAVAGMAASYGGSIVTLVSDTVRGWDAQTVTDRLEQAVGRHPPYIRLHGTLGGGPGQSPRGVPDGMRKVAWPGRAEVIRYSVIVTVCVIVYMIFVGGIDFGLSKVADWFYA